MSVVSSLVHTFPVNHATQLLKRITEDGPQ